MYSQFAPSHNTTMDFLHPEENIHYFEPDQTNHVVATGNHAADQGIVFGSSISFPGTNVSGRRKRNKWAKEEDASLLDAIGKHPSGKKNWTLIAARVNNQSHYEPRTGKQCRERWQNHLRPNIKKGNWTAEEEEMIRVMFETYGPKWSSMSKLMMTRTDNDIKNKWYSMQRANKLRKRKAASQVAIKRSLKARAKERQEILDLVGASKTADLPVVAHQDENQPNACNDAHDFDDLQPYPLHHKGEPPSQDVWDVILTPAESTDV